MLRAICHFVAVVCCIAVLVPTGAVAGQRLALVIGNNAYQNLGPGRQLQKAVNDARAVGSALTRIGFTVTPMENATRSAISDALGGLEEKIAPGDTVFLFFAGHGIDIAGTNYLLPSDIPSPVDAAGRRLPPRVMRDASFNAADVLSSLHAHGATVIAVFDACREPFDEEGSRAIGITGGLAEMKPPTGIFIMFSAGAKQLALDRLAQNDSNPDSVFTRSLIPLLGQQGLSLAAMAKEVQPRVRDLAAQVNHLQEPAYYDQIIGDFYLVPGQAVAGTQPAPPPPAPSFDPCSGSYEHWKSAESIGTRAALEAHLDIFPNCNFASLARAKMAALEIPPPAPPPPPAPALPPSATASVCQGSGSLWDFAGSTIFLRATPDSPTRTFYYCDGVRAGGVLFTGRRAKNRYEGTAYVVSSRCGSVPYDVSGEVLNGDRTVVITGSQPQVDESTCSVRNRSYVRLEFNYRSRN